MHEELEPLLDNRPDDLEEMFEDTSRKYKITLAAILILLMIIGYLLLY